MPLNKLTSAILITLASQAANASGFSLIEQSASGQGTSYAGAAASAEDASVMWFNPAGLTEIEGHQLILGGHVIAPKAQFTNDGSYLVASANKLQGADDNGATVGFVPNFYWKGQAGDYDIGLGINVPFGQHISYDDKWVGRYHATETNLRTININPAIARQINEELSFGFGLNVQYVDLIMEQQLNLGSSTGTAGDDVLKIDADSWGYGYNLGFLWQPQAATNIGLAYRSSVTHNAKGRIDYPAAAPYSDGKISSNVSLPATASLSATQAYGKFTLLADATWTKWSDYGSLIIKNASGSTITDTRQNFKDSWRYSVGGLYQMSEATTLRAGLALDQTPISSEKNRSPRTPDSDRRWVSVGMGYKLSSTMSLDLGYSHLFADKAQVNYTTDDKHYLKGSYESAVDIFSAQMVWKY